MLQFQTLNIMDKTTEITGPVETTETQICYGPSSNLSKPITNKTNNNQDQVKILKRDPTDYQKKDNKSDMKCMLCNDPHATHRCPQTRHL